MQARNLAKRVLALGLPMMALWIGCLIGASISKLLNVRPDSTLGEICITAFAVAGSFAGRWLMELALIRARWM